MVQDVENYDPILNPVLNREVRRTGGRVLVTLGDQDIDLSPSFMIFLSTRDPSVNSLLIPPTVSCLYVRCCLSIRLNFLPICVQE